MQQVTHTRRKHLQLLAVASAGLVTAGCTGGSNKASGLPTVADCQSSTVNVFPSPGTPCVSPRAQVSFRGRPAGKLGTVRVSGSSSGAHKGKLRAHSDGNGASFVPDKPFAAGEKVTIDSDVDIRGAGCGSFSFRVANGTDSPPPPLKERPAGAQEVQSFRSRPDLKPTVVTVNTDKNPSGLDYIFVAPQHGPGQNGPMILDGHGELVWFDHLDNGHDAMDFRVQHYRGERVLTWWEGAMKLGFAPGSFVIADSSYRHIKRVYSAGYEADAHEFIITPENTALIICYQALRMDLSAAGGPAEADLINSLVQEIDIETGLMLFEWHSLGHIGVDESYAKMPKKNGARYDFAHLNSVDFDEDGNLIFCARNTHAVYKVDRSSGEVTWRLGGKRSDFTMGEGTEFAFQHDARSYPDGTLSLFDNQAKPQVGEQSRAIVLDLDDKAMKATLEHEYTHPEKLVSGSQGNAHRPGNGSVFVGWGSQPYFTLFSESGEILFDARFSSGNGSYRAFTFPWKGTPDDRPAAAAATGRDGVVSVFASWNGATELTDWQVVAGPDTRNLAAVGSVTGKDGFETTITVDTAEPYVAARALDSSGKTLATSEAIKPQA